MMRPNVAQKRRLYDDLNPTFGLNKRGRHNSLNPRTGIQYLNQRRLFIPGDRENFPPSNSSSPFNDTNFGNYDCSAVGQSSESPYFHCNNQQEENYVSTTNVTVQYPKPSTQKLTVVKQYQPTLTKEKVRNSLYFLTGTVDKVLLWSKMIRNHRVLFEVYGVCDYVRQGSNVHEKYFMMRDSNASPILQVFFLEIDRPLIPLEPGSLVKVQGNMKSRSRFQAFNVQKSNMEELNASQRAFYICDRAAHDLVN